MGNDQKEDTAMRNAQMKDTAARCCTFCFQRVQPPEYRIGSGWIQSPVNRVVVRPLTTDIFLVRPGTFSVGIWSPLCDSRVL